MWWFISCILALYICVFVVYMGGCMGCMLQRVFIRSSTRQLLYMERYFTWNACAVSLSRDDIVGWRWLSARVFIRSAERSLLHVRLCQVLEHI